MSTYFMSDPHFNHLNVIPYCNRPFKNVNHMNISIIDNVLKTIKDDDKLFLLGDIWDAEYLKFFNYFEVYFILGNHDKHPKSKYNKIIEVIERYDLKNIIVYENPIKINSILIISHEPFIGSGPFINIHGHLHNKFMKNDIQKEKYYINCCVENINYTPIKIEELFKQLKNVCKI